MPRPSYKAALLAKTLDVTVEQLPGTLRAMKGEGESLRGMAARLSRETGVEVGHSWLIRYLNAHK